MMDKIIGIAVHVDTFVGMRHGVPALLDLFKRLDVLASIFVPMGKDHTGWTVKRVFTRKGFLKKAGRVGVLDTYGIKTLMYGLLLPGPEIAKKNMDIMRRIRDEGHELGIHGSDHVFWHDHIKDFNKERTEKEVDSLLSVYKNLTGTDAISFAAPGWMINPHVLRQFQKKGLIYSSDTRGTSPFYPQMAGETFSVPQIPTTLPTLDEVLGTVGSSVSTLKAYYLNSLVEGFNILTVHTELEGKHWIGLLEEVIQGAHQLGFTFSRLIDIAEVYRKNSGIPTCAVEYGYVNGRAGEVCLQGKTL